MKSYHYDAWRLAYRRAMMADRLHCNPELVDLLWQVAISQGLLCDMEQSRKKELKAKLIQEQARLLAS